MGGFDPAGFDPAWMLAVLVFFAVGITFVIASLASTKRKVRDAEKAARKHEKPS